MTAPPPAGDDAAEHPCDQPEAERPAADALSEALSGADAEAAAAPTAPAADTGAETEPAAPGDAEPGTDQASADEPSTDKPGTGKPTADEPAPSEAAAPVEAAPSAVPDDAIPDEPSAGAIPEALPSAVTTTAALTDTAAPTTDPAPPVVHPPYPVPQPPTPPLPPPQTWAQRLTGAYPAPQPPAFGAQPQGWGYPGRHQWHPIRADLYFLAALPLMLMALGFLFLPWLSVTGARSGFMQSQSADILGSIGDDGEYLHLTVVWPVLLIIALALSVTGVVAVLVTHHRLARLGTLLAVALAFAFGLAELGYLHGMQDLFNQMLGFAQQDAGDGDVGVSASLSFGIGAWLTFVLLILALASCVVGWSLERRDRATPPSAQPAPAGPGFLPPQQPWASWPGRG